MQIIPSVNDMQAVALKARHAGKRISLVPTMGFLHEGHLSLVRKARDLSDFLVVSIFVNPTQFGPHEGFDSYPRDMQRDHHVCRNENVDVVFCPSSDEIYADDHSVTIEETQLSAGLCGGSRPGHFRGVITIVAKLFNIIHPHIAVLGQKDAQQSRVIEKMVRDLNFPIEIITLPTVREPDGLAMSSRNSCLSKQERERATCIYKSLCLAQRLYTEQIKDADVISNRMRELIMRNQPSPVPVDIDYIEIRDDRTLKPIDRIKDSTLIAVAVRIGNTRLIDNVILGGSHSPHNA